MNRIFSSISRLFDISVSIFSPLGGVRRGCLLSVVCCLLTLTGCSDEGEISQVTPPLDNTYLPQGGDAAADAAVQALYDRYGSFFLYDFTEERMNWTQVETGSYDTYRRTPLEAQKVTTLLEALEQCWFSLYPEEFNVRCMPRFVYLTEQLEKGAYNIWKDTYTWSPVTARYQEGQIALSNVPKAWGEMTAAEKKTYKSQLQSVVLAYYQSQKCIEVPEEFFAESTYGGATMNATAARNAGFIPNPATGKDWATEDMTITREQDVEAYLAAMACNTSSEWRSLYNGKPKIKNKYDILKAYLQELNFKITP